MTELPNLESLTSFTHDEVKLDILVKKSIEDGFMTEEQLLIGRYVKEYLILNVQAESGSIEEDFERGKLLPEAYRVAAEQFDTNEGVVLGIYAKSDLVRTRNIPLYNKKTKKDLEIVGKIKKQGFGAFIQYAYFEYPRLFEILREDKLPEKKRLIHLRHRIFDYSLDFEDAYILFPEFGETSLLNTEKSMWEHLSPDVKNYLKRFKDFMGDYDETTTNPGQTTTILEEGWDILQDWNAISNIYKVKYIQWHYEYLEDS